MTLSGQMIAVFGALVVAASIAIIGLAARLRAARAELQSERMRQKSISASYGRISEQWFPLMERYPYDSSNFRFLGTPIDGVQFEADRILFVEFKSRTSELSPLQKRLKRLVQEGRVQWEEFHFLEE
ncbi:MAG TPA: Holliday junction resolvase-like protein [Chthonomonadales bacterium]|nr:Holliday junction resolvase-like protein [Chthonomonadales bacterium]